MAWLFLILAGEPLVTVNVLGRYQPTVIYLDHLVGLVIVDADVRRIEAPAVITHRGMQLHLASPSGEFLSNEIAFAPAWHEIRFLNPESGRHEARTYFGAIRFRLKTKGEIFCLVEMERGLYSTSVAYAETEPLWQVKDGPLFGRPAAKAEFLAAMEVAVNSYAHHPRHESEGFHFCDRSHCQVFVGVRGGQETDPPGLLRHSDGHVIQALFHATCGGVLGQVDSYWEGGTGSTCSRVGADKSAEEVEANCSLSPHFNWWVNVDHEVLGKILAYRRFADLGIQTRDRRVVAITYRDAWGQPRKLAVAAFRRRAGRTLGWNKIKSNLFTLESTLTGYRFVGRGFGHGIGLCQWGAAQMAANGASRREILSFYYPGCIFNE